MCIVRLLGLVSLTFGSLCFFFIYNNGGGTGNNGVIDVNLMKGILYVLGGGGTLFGLLLLLIPNLSGSKQGQNQ